VSRNQFIPGPLFYQLIMEQLPVHGTVIEAILSGDSIVVTVECCADGNAWREIYLFAPNGGFWGKNVYP
jgi:hypothetical protein